MPKYPILRPQEIIRILKLLGFAEVRQKGSHKQFKHIDGRFTTLPFHKSKDISPLLLRQILNDIKVELEEFKRFM